MDRADAEGLVGAVTGLGPHQSRTAVVLQHCPIRAGPGSDAPGRLADGAACVAGD